MKYWSFDGDCWETHATAEEARARCEAALEAYRDYAPEGWPDEVESIMWGPIAERAGCLTDTGYDCDDDCEVAGPWDYRVDYELKPTSEEER